MLFRSLNSLHSFLPISPKSVFMDQIVHILSSSSSEPSTESSHPSSESSDLSNPSHGQFNTASPVPSPESWSTESSDSSNRPHIIFNTATTEIAQNALDRATSVIKPNRFYFVLSLKRSFVEGDCRLVHI